jgi:hypothetical protein
MFTAAVMAGVAILTMAAGMAAAGDGALALIHGTAATDTAAGDGTTGTIQAIMAAGVTAGITLATMHITTTVIAAQDLASIIMAQGAIITMAMQTDMPAPGVQPITAGGRLPQMVAGGLQAAIR